MGEPRVVGPSAEGTPIAKVVKVVLNGRRKCLTIIACAFDPVSKRGVGEEIATMGADGLIEGGVHVDGKDAKPNGVTGWRRAAAKQPTDLNQ